MNAPDSDLSEQALFVSGEDGYHTYRIPAIIVTMKGTVLAFCEGRKNGRPDTGEIHMCMKRSADGGATWGPLRVIAKDGPHTMGNPCPVVDRETGAIWMLMTHNLGHDRESAIIDGTSEGTRTVWAAKSGDDGETWSAPVEITATTKRPDWTWYATGPGVGVQLRNGRLVIPSDHVVAGTGVAGSHAIFSDDGGASWRLGGIIEPGVNECQAVELADGRLLMNMRNHRGVETERYTRALAYSADGGESWSEISHDDALVEPRCQASVLRYTTETAHGANRILFSNPGGDTRHKMTVRMSADEGKTWPVARQLHEGPSAYSCLTVLPDMRVGCLYEAGEENAYETIRLAAFSLECFTGGADRAS